MPVECPECGKPMDDETMRLLIRRQLEKVKENMRENKQHISDYGRFAIVEELIKAFEEDDLE